MPDLETVAKELLQERWTAAGSFFERAEKELSASPGVGFRALFASVTRRLGGLAEETVAPAFAAARPHWALTDYARLWLIRRALAKVAPEDQPGFLLQLFEAGELREQVSVLRVLPALPEPGRFLEVGLQACRTNARDVFEAAVCENPFLAEHFPPLNFNQAVMKAIFMEVPLRRIEQLERRITTELSRMAAGYASERCAAGRKVPADAEYLSNYGA